MIDTVFGGRYRITEKIGIGGMAEVYKATDETLGRTVAVKVMLPQYASDETFTIRFKQEAQAAANLQSPYIVNIYDWGYEQANQTYFIVMEYIRGTDLKTAITQRGAINQRKVAEIGAQVATALGVAHNNDIIHRDIKPQNIMVQPDGNAKVMDFGIARTNSANLTQTGSVLGTAYYVSPEQAQGKQLTSSTDIYSLGVVLYEAVTGRVPFDGPDAVSIAVKQVNEQPVPPRAIDASIDAGLEAIIMKAMQKNPADRFITADEMRLALTDYLQGKPIKNIDSGARTRIITTPAVVPPAQATAVMPELATSASYTKAGGSNQPKKKSNTPLIVTLICVLAALLIGVVLYFTMCADSGEGNIQVPDLTKMTPEEAVQALEAAGLELGETTEENSESIEAGLVIKHDPPARAMVAPGTKVNLTISTGSGKVKVPNLTGLTPEQAAAELEKVGLKLKTGDTKPDPTIPAGSISGQSPAPDNMVDKDSEVTVTISSGVETAEVPNVYGMEKSLAEAAITGNGFKVTFAEDAYSDSVAIGYVVSQDIVGTQSKGVTVTLTISAGPKPPDPKPVQQVPVPLLVTNSMNYTNALATMQAAGLIMNPSGDVNNGVVISVDPAEGTMVDVGSTVNVTFGTP